MNRLATAAAATIALAGTALAWTGFTPGPEYQPTVCFISPQEGTTIAIEPMKPDTATTSGGKALVLTGIMGTAFPGSGDDIAAAAKRIRAAAAFAKIDLANSVAVISDVTLTRVSPGYTVAIPLRSAVEGNVTLPDGVVLQDFAPLKIAEMRFDGRRTDLPGATRTLMDYITRNGMTSGKTFITEFYSDEDLTSSEPTTIELCGEVK